MSSNGNSCCTVSKARTPLTSRDRDSDTLLDVLGEGQDELLLDRMPPAQSPRVGVKQEQAVLGGWVPIIQQDGSESSSRPHCLPSACPSACPNAQCLGNFRHRTVSSLGLSSGITTTPAPGSCED